MSIWYVKPTLERLNALIVPQGFSLLDQSMGENQLLYHMGIVFTDVGPDYLEGRMPVDERTTQSFGVIHGAAHTVLADTIGGVASNCTVDRSLYFCVTIEMKTNITKPVREGYVHAFAKPLHLGKTTQVWNVHSHDDQNDLVSYTTLTMMIKKRATPELPS